MKLAPDAFEAVVNVARGFLADRESPTYGDKGLAGYFAEALVQIADRCTIGVPCDRHGGAVHGQEAEELRAGVEQILKNTSDVRDNEAAFVLAEQRKALIFLLDRINARDSFAFLEATDPSEESAPDRT
jgi:hypothetical protein